MKQMNCLDCDETFTAETSKEILDQMHPHYMEKHKDVMAAGDEEKKKAWFEQFNKDWDAAEEVSEE